MLATVLLAFSDYYLFTAFFKVTNHIYFDIWQFRILWLLTVFKDIGRSVTLFFQVFLLVVTFGLFHGLVFLPVLLCLVRTCFSLFSYIYNLFMKGGKLIWQPFKALIANPVFSLFQNSCSPGWSNLI